MPEPELIVEALHKAYGSRRVLHGFNLHLKTGGRVVGVFGPNGVGKTTLFRCILGMERYHASQLRWSGTSIHGLRTDRIARLGVAMMFQKPVALDGLTVHQQLTLIFEERFGRRDDEQLERIIEANELSALRNSRVSSLSFGEAKLVDFARVMMLEPGLMLLDEPFSGLDPLHIQPIKQRIREAATLQRLVLLTDHNLHQALDFVDQVVVLYEGRVLFAGDSDAARADPQVRSLYLGDHA